MATLPETTSWFPAIRVRTSLQQSIKGALPLSLEVRGWIKKGWLQVTGCGRSVDSVFFGVLTLLVGWREGCPVRIKTCAVYPQSFSSGTGGRKITKGNWLMNVRLDIMELRRCQRKNCGIQGFHASWKVPEVLDFLVKFPVPGKSWKMGLVMESPGNISTRSWNFLGYDVAGGYNDAGADAKNLAQIACIC